MRGGGEREIGKGEEVVETRGGRGGREDVGGSGVTPGGGGRETGGESQGGKWGGWTADGKVNGRWRQRRTGGGEGVGRRGGI